LLCSLFGTYSPQERSCGPRVQWLRMVRRPRFHELVPVYVQSACDSAETSIYLSQPTCELCHIRKSVDRTTIPKLPCCQCSVNIFSAAMATEEHIRPPFLLGEEAQDDIDLSDGKKIFINDVLETAEWYVLWKCSVYPTQRKPSDQGRHTRATKQLPFHRPERVHCRLCRPMGRPFPNLVPFHCR
jgi:hypothetical protein